MTKYGSAELADAVVMMAGLQHFAADAAELGYEVLASFTVSVNHSGNDAYMKFVYDSEWGVVLDA